MTGISRAVHCAGKEPRLRVWPRMSAFGGRADKNRRQIALAPAAQWFVENVAPRLDREKRAGVNTGVNIHGAVTVTLR